MTVEISGRRDVVFRCRRVLIYMIGSCGEIPFMRRFSRDNKLSFFGRTGRMRTALGLSPAGLTRALRRLQDDGHLIKRKDGYLIKRKGK